MKHARKLASLLLALVMVFALATTAFAAGTGTITITNATVDNTYKVYKVFEADGNATNIAYTLVSGKAAAPSGFTVDPSTGNVSHNGDELTAEDIAAIAEYVAADQPVKEATASSTTVAFTGLPNGYYYITTTTGTAVTVTSTNPDATVQDKNVPPETDKKITAVGDGSFDENGKKALAEVGTTVTYTATIKVANGAVGYVFHDKMSGGLSYNANSLTVKIGDNAVASSNYTTTAAQGDTITISFNDEWIKTQVGQTITITYTATVTSDALTVTPAKNTANVEYGHNGKVNYTPDKTTEIYNAKLTVTKKDGTGNALAGAGFVISKTTGEAADAKTVYYKKNNNDIEWVEDIDQATEMKTTSASNVVSFTGLADGTYTLTEKTVPAGYNKAEDYSFTINAGNYDQNKLELSTEVTNNAGTLLPSTGGMGTTIFYVLGSILAVGAIVLLVTKKRMNASDK